MFLPNKIRLKLFSRKNFARIFNPLSANPIKWSHPNNWNCLSVFDHFVGLELKALKLLLKICPKTSVVKSNIRYSCKFGTLPNLVSTKHFFNEIFYICPFRNSITLSLARAAISNNKIRTL